jgi:hypothetical protein
MLFQLIRDQRLLNEKAVFADEQAGNQGLAYLLLNYP